MSIAHSELVTLASLPDQFPLIGEYLDGATIEVSFVRDGEVRERTHLIVKASDFPIVFIVAEGSAAAAAKRDFFGSTGIYDGRVWALADEADEDAMRAMIADKRRQDAASAAAARAEMARRRAAREEAERAAEALRTEENRAAARERLLEAYRDRSGMPRWGSVLHDLDMLMGLIERAADRSFVADLAFKRRRFGAVFTERRVAWLVLADDVYFQSSSTTRPLVTLSGSSPGSGAFTPNSDARLRSAKSWTACAAD